MSNIINYNLILRYDENKKGYHVYSFDFDNCEHSFEKTKEEAIQAGKEIIILELDYLKDQGIYDVSPCDMRDYELLENEEHYTISINPNDELKKLCKERYGKLRTMVFK